MMEVSNNSYANALYKSLRSPKSQILGIASLVAMKLFSFNDQGTVYVLGRSRIDANDMSRLTGRLFSIIPKTNLALVRTVMSHVTPKEGMLKVLPGTVYSKEGYTSVSGGYVYNETALFYKDGAWKALSMIVRGPLNETSAAAIIQRVTHMLVYGS
jgi:hypothetical protein